MPRQLWSVLLVAAVCGGIAVVATLPFEVTEREPSGVIELPGLVQAPLSTPEASPTPTPEPATARRVSRAPAAPAPAPAQQQDQNSIDDLPDGPFGTAKDAVNDPPQ